MFRKKTDKLWWLVAAVVLLVLAAYFHFALYGYVTTAAVLLGLAAFCLLQWLFRRRKAACIALAVLLCVAVLMVGIAEVPVITASRGDVEAQAPYLVVLGAGLNGAYPSTSLLDRLVAARDYLEAHPQTVAIVSGGQGPGEDITEAQAMYDWLVSQGIDGARVLKEERATSTEENLRYAFDMIRARGDDPADGVAIVSSEYHLYRAKQMAAQLGATPYGVAGRTQYASLRANYFLREAFAVWYLWVFGM